jgi:hypothetical protein
MQILVRQIKSLRNLNQHKEYMVEDRKHLGREMSYYQKNDNPLNELGVEQSDHLNEPTFTLDISDNPCQTYRSSTKPEIYKGNIEYVLKKQNNKQ